MKLKTIALVSALSFAGSAAFAAGGFEIKAGVGSVKAAGDKIGFDAGLAYSMKVERFFAVTPELGFNWINFDQCAGTTCQTVQIGGTTGTLTETRNHFTLPLIMNLRFLIPMGSEDTPVFQPFVSAGAGYAWTFFKSEVPAYSVGGVSQAATTTNYDAGGLAYQMMVGGLINLGMIADGSASSTNILVEAGYRGIEVERSGIKTNMSGFIARVGAAFSF